MKKELLICPACGKRGVQRSYVPPSAVAYGDNAYIYKCRYCKKWSDERPTTEKG